MEGNRDIKLNIDKFKAEAYVSEINSILNDIEKRFPNLYSQVVESKENQYESISNEAKKISKKVDKTFHVQLPSLSDLNDIRILVEEYQAFTEKSDTVNLSEKYSNMVSNIDVNKIENIKSKLTVIDSQMKIVEQIPENRLEKNKTKIHLNLAKQNQISDKKEIVELRKEFERIHNEINHLSESIMVSNTTMTDIKSFNKISLLSTKEEKQKKILIWSSIGLVLLSIATIATILLLAFV